MTNLPKFKYYSNPFEDDVFVKENITCMCCGKVSEYKYVGWVWSKTDVYGKICPWCIANGSVFVEFSSTFNHIPTSEIDDERKITALKHCTPGLPTMQEMEWPVHCCDIPVFEGEAEKEDLEKITEKQFVEFVEREFLNEEEAREYIATFIANETPMFFKFTCSKCKERIFKFEFN